MTCITHAILPTTPDGAPAGLVLDRLALRRAVRRIFHGSWDKVKAAIADPNHPEHTRMVGMSCSEVVNMMTLDTLVETLIPRSENAYLRPPAVERLVKGQVLNHVTDTPDWRSRLRAKQVDEALGIYPTIFGPFDDGLTVSDSMIWAQGLANVMQRRVRLLCAAPNGKIAMHLYDPLSTVWTHRPPAPPPVSHGPTLDNKGNPALSLIGNVHPAWRGLYASALAYMTSSNQLIGAGSSTPDFFSERLIFGQSLASKTTATSTKNQRKEQDVTLHSHTKTPTLTVSPDVAGMMNAMLTAVNLPKIDELLDKANQFEGLNVMAADLRKALDDKEAQLTQAKAAVGGVVVKIDAQLQAGAAANGGWPAYALETTKATQAFAIEGTAGKAFDFEVPVFRWQGPCHEVPKVDPDYLFRPRALLSTLYALVTGQNLWLSGHTGTGKSTLVEQVCARLGWPMVRINLDSEITRLDLMGRDVITQVNGNTVTRFEEGLLPYALQRPMVLLLDEVDFGRPDVMYALQRVAEGGGLTLTEDGGRHIAPHPLFRMIATANTLGQGDDTGLYQGARIQSAAFLDRFTAWVSVPPLELADIETLVAKRVPQLPPEAVKRIAQYTHEHGICFRERQVATPISPRGAVALAQSFNVFRALVPESRAREMALAQTIMDRAPETDRKVLLGVADRIWK